MNYRKLIESVIYRQKNHNLTAFAVIAGLAAGAALAALFALRSGKQSRKMLVGNLSDLSDQLKESFSFTSHHQSHKLEDPVFDDVRETIREHADHLQGPESKRKDPTQIKVPSAGTTAWKNNL